MLWSLIAGRLPGRTDNEIKNYWNTHIKRKLINRGIDPQTHRTITSSAISTATVAPFDLRNASLPGYLSVPPLADVESPHQSTLRQIRTADSPDDGKCNSGTTEETDPRTPPHADVKNCQSVDLELSIGLVPFQSRTAISSANSADSKLRKRSPYELMAVAATLPQQTPVPSAAAQLVCLCWQLGFQSGKLCSNCQSANVFI
ncbi:hypothetical protein U1Q18_036950 [Sarracenia purpurea var. burkii]